MELLIILAAIGILGVLINKFANSAVVSIIGVVAFASLVIYLIVIMFLYYTTKAEIKEFHSLEAEFQSAKAKGNVYTNTALLVDVRESNEWLSNAQNWNRTIFELCIPDEINELKPIE